MSKIKTLSPPQDCRGLLIEALNRYDEIDTIAITVLYHGDSSSKYGYTGSERDLTHCLFKMLLRVLIER